MKKSRSTAAASDEKRRKTLLPWTRSECYSAVGFIYSMY